MNKGDGWYSGASTIPDTLNNLFSQEQKSRIAMTSASGYSLPILASFPFGAGNGLVLPALGSTDLHLVADDLTPGSNWTARVGGRTATKDGTPTVALETPWYPSGGFAGTGYRKASQYPANAGYHLPYNATDELTATSTVTYELYLKLGIPATEETYLSRYIAAFLQYNFRLYAKDSGGSVLSLYAEVGHLVSSAAVNVAQMQSSYNLVAFTYDGPSQTVALYVNGVSAGSSAGTGAIINDHTSSTFIGTGDPATVALPAINGQVIEIMRHNAVLTPTVLMNRAQVSMGIASAAGDYPVTYQRATMGTVEVNKKLWAIGLSYAMTNEKGLYCDVNRRVEVTNNCLTDGSSGIVLSTNATQTTESGSFTSQISITQPVTIPLNGLAESVRFNATSMQPNHNSAMTVVWRPIGSPTTKAYAYIYDLPGLKYYTPGSPGTWGAAAFAIDLTAYVVRGAGTLADPYVSSVPYTTQVYAGTRTHYNIIHNNAAFSGGSSIRVYFNDSDLFGQSYVSPYIISRNTGVDGTTMLSQKFSYNAALINWNKGRITFTFKPIFSTAIPSVSASPGINGIVLMGGNSGSHFLNVTLGTSTFRFHDAAGNTVTLSPTFTQYEQLDFQLDWSNVSNTMTMQITNKALSITGTFAAPLSSGNFAFYNGNLAPQGYISNVVIRG